MKLENIFKFAKKENNGEEKRYCVLDEIRGFVLLNMLAYHTMWDLVYIYRHNISWYRTGLGRIWQQFICCGFILLSGFCISLGKHRARRGITVFVCGLIITAATVAFMPKSRVVFGVLTLIGSCMLFFCPLDGLLSKIKPLLGMTVCIALFALLKNIKKGFIGFGGHKLISLPAGLYANLFTAYWGFPPNGFYSADYFPVFPWLLLFCTGYFLYRFVQNRDLMKYLRSGKCRPLRLLGRYSLQIYMLHQPVIYFILYLLHL